MHGFFETLIVIFVVIAGILLILPIILAVKLSKLKRQVEAMEKRLNALAQTTPTEPLQPEKVEKPQLRVVSDTTRTESKTAPIITRIEKPKIIPIVAAEIKPSEEKTVEEKSQNIFAPQAEQKAYFTASPAEDKESLFSVVFGFFTKGNPVVRIGMVIVFFGVAFLVKYAAEHQMFPIELRLAAVAAGGIAMLLVGWRLRESRRGYALILQGGAVGILYLDLFAAAKLYHLIPMGFAFTVMTALVALSGVLAILQDAQGLAAFGAAGGFLAPVLTSTGGGSHVMLFSYYALLNLGILGIAWFKSWRPLNLIGFAFTFAIGTVWGSNYYQPAHFATTEPFLIFFFLLYVAVSILFAHRQPPNLKGFVDGSLVFGLPAIAFALQSALIRQYEYGTSLSALSMSAFYIGLATWLWRSRIDGMRMLTESFLALGVVFGSLAIPLASGGRQTSAVWALEGAAMVWIGIRQNRCLARNFGILLQVGAAIAFLSVSKNVSGDTPVFNGFYLGCIAVSFAALFSSFYLERHQEKLRVWELIFPAPMMIWGLLWWFGAGWHEIDRFVAYSYQLNAHLLFISISCLCMGELFRLLQWNAIRNPQWLMLPVMILFAANVFLKHSWHPFANIGAIVWGTAFIAQYRFLWQGREFRSTALTFWHLASLWLMVLVLTRESAWATNWLVNGAGTWEFISYGIVPGIFTLILLMKGEKIRWPVVPYLNEYLEIGLMVLWIYLGLWELVACFQPGNPWPLSYLPILNPLDIAQIFVIMVMIRWVWQIRKSRFFAYILVFTTFIWLTAVLGRAVHFWGDVSYTTHALFDSTLFQASVSILWTLIAFGAMVWATRKDRREVWVVGAWILGIVVVKLFFKDLAGTGTVARIVSFLAVGILMLVIGYISPVPPKK